MGYSALVTPSLSWIHSVWMANKIVSPWRRQRNNVGPLVLTYDRGVFAKLIHRGHRVARCQGDKLVAAGVEEWIGGHQVCGNAQSAQSSRMPRRSPGRCWRVRRESANQWRVPPPALRPIDPALAESSDLGGRLRSAPQEHNPQRSSVTPPPVLRKAWKWGARPDFRQQGCRTRPSRRAK